MTTLRDLTAQDLDEVVRWRNDSKVNRYLSNRVKTKSDAFEWFHRIKSDPNNLLMGIVQDDRLVGYCIVENVDPQNRKCEVGIIIGLPQQWGKGIATSVMKELLKHCFNELSLHRVLAVIARGNRRSEQLFRKMGFRHEGTLRDATKIRGHFTDLLCYSILETEYKK